MTPKQKQKGSIILFAVAILSILVGISGAVAAILIPKLKVSSDSLNSVVSIYAADSGIEWCLYLFRKKPNPPAMPTMDPGVTLEIYRGNSNKPATCSSKESPLDHRAVGTFRGVSRSLEVQ